jgi:hypothetical protein
VICLDEKNQDSKKTSIGLEKDTRSRLQGLGKKGETYDDVINRLIDFYESSQ